MGNVDRACVQMEAVFDFAAPTRRRAAIFEVPDNGRAERGEVHANLVHTSGYRLDRYPGEFGARSIDDDIIGHGRFRAFPVLIHLADLFLAARLLLPELRADAPARATGYAPGQSPINLLRVAAAERVAKRRGCQHRSRNHQYARGVPVEAVYEPRPLPLSKREKFEQPVHVLLDPAS